MGLYENFDRLATFIKSLGAATTAARGAFDLTRNRNGMSQAAAELQARSLVNHVLRFGAAARNVSDRDQNLGSWKPETFDGLQPQNQRTTEALRGPDARRAKTTAGIGLEPLSFAPMPEITIPAIASAHARAHRTGWVDRKADIDQRQRRDDSHVKGIVGKLGAWVYKTPLRVRSASGSPLGILVANAARAALDQCDGLTSAVSELQVMSSVGFGAGELQWRDTTLSIPIDRRHREAVRLEVVGSIAQIYPRNFAFNLIDDEPWLCYGPSDYQPIQSEELRQKFIFLRASGDGPTRFRGCGWANSWLSYLGGLTLEKFGTVVEVFGLAVPYLQRDGEGFLSDSENQHALDILERLGTGQPEVIPGRYGELKHSPVPAGLAPIHAQMLGLVKTEQSKLWLRSTLAVEIGNVGSQAAATVHADGLVDTQREYAGITADALRSQVVRYFLEANAEALAKTFSRYVPGGCTPDDVACEPVIVEWPLSDQTQQQRLAVFQGVKGLGFALDESQVRAELGVLAPLVESPAAPADTHTEPPADAEATATPAPVEAPETAGQGTPDATY